MLMRLAMAGAAGPDDSAGPEPEAASLPTWDRARWLGRYVLPHEPMLRSWLRRRAVRGLEIDDIVQETYALLAGLASVEHIASPRAYAFQTAHSLIQRHLRRAQVARFETVGDAGWSRYALDEPSPEQQASAREQLRRLAGLVAGLPPKRREAFTLRKVEGLSQREVARRMGISENTVEKHVALALRTLMQAMA
ncbi:RNA polymerase sigma factor [Phenylobacterium sp.]|uniref:RNA polymerase sigma factor n=1 Tax=Phenylobacterium sp. TaxID=1871053 RepID=UPI003565508B